MQDTRPRRHSRTGGTFRLASGQSLSTDPKRLAVFDYDLQHELRLVKAPRVSGHRGSRAGVLLPCRPIRGCTDPPALWPVGEVHEAFDDRTTNTTGFYRIPELGRTPFQWTQSTHANVFARLPQQRMGLALTIAAAVDDGFIRSFRLRVNGIALPVHEIRDGALTRVSATIPATALAPSLDDIALIAPVRRDGLGVAGVSQPLGLAVKRIDISPLKGDGD
jgi:hypothetical protein